MRKKTQFIFISGLVALFFGAFFTPVSDAAEKNQEQKKAKILHFTRSQGFEHGPAKRLEDGTTISGNALKKYFEPLSIELVETQDGRVFDGDIDQYDAFSFYTSGNLEDSNGSRNPHSFAMSGEGVRKMIDAVRNGKGFLGIHSGCDTYCNQKEKGKDIFTSFVGARFSGHGPQQVATVSITEPVELPWIKKIEGKTYTAHEEWYGMLQFNPDIHVVLIQETEGMEGDDYNRPPFPSSWIRKEGKGRVAYTAFGHRDDFWEDEENVARVGEFLLWGVGRFEMDTTPNFEKLTPKGNQPPVKNR